MKPNFRTLGKKTTKFTKLETFPTPRGVTCVICTSDEVTAVCPVTGQPDWYTVEITYYPKDKCVESKALKLYLQSFRNDGHFCEDFASIIARDLHGALGPCSVNVKVTQKPRGGIAIASFARAPQTL